jgi:hypothetical protein
VPDAAGLMPGQVGYDPSTDPSSSSYNQQSEVDWFVQNQIPASVTAAANQTPAAGASASGSQQGTAGASGGSSLPQFTPNMTPDQVRTAANAYIAAAGIPNTDNGQYWVNMYANSNGASDPAYIQSQLENGIVANGGNPAAFGPASATAPGGYGPGTPGASDGSAAGSNPAGVNVSLPGAPTFNPYAPTTSFVDPTTGVPTPTALSQLATPTGATATQFTPPPDFVAPTLAQAEAQPGYQFAEQQGAQTLQASALASGLGQSGGTAEALINYGQQAAETDYQNVYNNALSAQAQAYSQGSNTVAQNNAATLAVQQSNAAQGLAYGTANNSAVATNNAAALAAQNQGYTQGANTYQTNYQNAFQTNQANNAGALANYQAQVSAALGQGNLQLGVGYQGLAANQQGYNQALTTNTTDFGQNLSLAQLGSVASPNYQGAGVTAGTTTQSGANAAAAGTVGAANATNAGLANLSNLGSSAALYSYAYPGAAPTYNVQATN